MSPAFPWWIPRGIPSPMQPKAAAGSWGRSSVWERLISAAGTSGSKPMPPDLRSRTAILSGMPTPPPISDMGTSNSGLARRASISRPPRRRNIISGGRSTPASPVCGGIRISHRLPAQQDHLFGGQLAPLADLQAADTNRSNGRADQFQYLATDGFDH